MPIREIKCQMLRACLIILTGAAICFAVAVWINNQQYYYDESNTFVYTGVLSCVRYDYSSGRRARYDYYTLYFADGQKFEIWPEATRELLNEEKVMALRTLPEGVIITVIASRSHGNVCAFWTADQTFFSVADYNRLEEKSIRFMYIMDGVLFVPFAVVAFVGYNYEFNELIVYYRKIRCKAKRKQLRNELKDVKRDKRQQ